jgi:hypothetical protein
MSQKSRDMGHPIFSLSLDLGHQSSGGRASQPRMDTGFLLNLLCSARGFDDWCRLHFVTIPGPSPECQAANKAGRVVSMFRLQQEFVQVWAANRAGKNKGKNKKVGIIFDSNARSSFDSFI